MAEFTQAVSCINWSLLDLNYFNVGTLCVTQIRFVSRPGKQKQLE